LQSHLRGANFTHWRRSRAPEAGHLGKIGQDVIKTHLREGWNEILAKVDNIMGTWELYLEFRTADGAQPLKMFSTSAPPPATAK
jgi:hypothetical protein